MGGQFDELAGQQAYVEQVIRSEEESFLKTLGTGIEIFDRITPYVKEVAGANGSAESAASLTEQVGSDHRAVDLLEKAFVDDDDRDAILEQFTETASEGKMPGDIAFLLHDTYGFPIDLTELMAREHNLGVDMERYNELMQRQKDRARSASSFDVDQSDVHAWQEISHGEASVFVGYDTTTVEDARIRALRTVETEEGDPRYEVELDRTPFYAESGGQVGDTGYLVFADESRVEVVNTKKSPDGDRIIHHLRTRPRILEGNNREENIAVEAHVDADRRRRIQVHHTATHLLHAALRDTLGDHVQQKGSRVGPGSLRFDFSHMQGVTSDELETIERIVNEHIQRNIEKQEDREVPIDEALSRGAMALFGEKYGDEVRVITFDPEYSVELCGGTHVGATGEIGLFRFLSEGSVAAGVRRVEAVAGAAAIDYVEGELNELQSARQQFASLQRPLHEEISALKEERDRLADDLETMRREVLAAQLDEFIQQASRADGVSVATGQVGDAHMDDLQALAQQLRDRMGEKSVGVLGSTGDGGEKAYVVVSVSDDLVRRGLKAGDLVGVLGQKLGGGGGGRPQLASAGGRDAGKLGDVLDEVPQLVQDALSGS